MKPQLNIPLVKAGNLTAFKTFFEFFYPKLMALACRFVNDEAAKDIVQEVFTTYWEQKGTIDADNIHSYLFKCVQNRCLNYLKHEMIVDEAHIRIAEQRIESLCIDSDSNETLQNLITRDVYEVIESSVQKLPPRCAEAFRLCFFHDLPQKEVAVIMNISLRTVETHIRQAVTFLKTDLHDLLLLILLFYPKK